MASLTREEARSRSGAEALANVESCLEVSSERAAAAERSAAAAEAAGVAARADAEKALAERADALEKSAHIAQVAAQRAADAHQAEEVAMTRLAQEEDRSRSGVESLAQVESRLELSLERVAAAEQSADAAEVAGVAARADVERVLAERADALEKSAHIAQVAAQRADEASWAEEMAMKRLAQEENQSRSGAEELANVESRLELSLERVVTAERSAAAAEAASLAAHSQAREVQAATQHLAAQVDEERSRAKTYEEDARRRAAQAAELREQVLHRTEEQGRHAKWRANAIPILATGIWRDGSAAKALASLIEDFDIMILSQDEEAFYESISVLNLLKAKGVDSSQCILTIGTGGGSCQFVLFENSIQVAKAYSKGYKNDTPDHKSKQDAMTRIWSASQGKREPTVIVAWGAVWHACKNGPVNRDGAELGSPAPAAEFPQAGFVIPAAETVPMLVIRNVDIGGGLTFKPHWGVESGVGSYIDLGSSKVARVSLRHQGTQEVNIGFDQAQAVAGNADQVRAALHSILACPSTSNVGSVLVAHDAAELAMDMQSRGVRDRTPLGETSAVAATASAKASSTAELDAARALAAALREEMDAAGAKQEKLETSLSIESVCLMEARQLEAKQSEELNAEMVALASLRHTISDQCMAVLNACSGDMSDSSDAPE